jgi:hypothetical protein
MELTAPIAVDIAGVTNTTECVILKMLSLLAAMKQGSEQSQSSISNRAKVRRHFNAFYSK